MIIIAFRRLYFVLRLSWERCGDVRFNSIDAWDRNEGLIALAYDVASPRLRP
jgi:hypothetical protein